MKKIAILSLVLVGCCLQLRAQLQKIVATPLYDNVHIGDVWKMNNKYALMDKDAMPNVHRLFFNTDRVNLSNRLISTTPTHDVYLKTEPLKKYNNNALQINK